MIDRERLAVGDSTPFENRLLSAARSETIPTELKLRMSQGLNLSAAALGGGSATALLSLNTIALVVLGAAALAGLAGVVVKQAHETRSPNAAVPHTVPAPTMIAVTPAAQPATAHPTTSHPEPSPRAQAVQASARANSSDSPAPVTRNHDADLREEIALLDAARLALAAGAPTKAMGVLGQYKRRYPNGTFAPEALALRIEALTDAGDSAMAHALARSFLKAHPSSPLAERVEQLAGSSR